MGFVANTLPILQAISLVIGIAVGIVTFIYYWKKVKAEEAATNAQIAADVVKATAKVAAAALKGNS